MDGSTTRSAVPQRPHHQRNKSSKTNILRSLVKSRPVSPEVSTKPENGAMSRAQTMPLLPSDHPHATKTRVLGERQSNVQSPPSSPSKRSTAKTSGDSRRRDTKETKVPTKTGDASAKPKKSKSSTSLSAMFGKMNRSSKDLTAYTGSTAQIREKENNTPPSSSDGPAETPIWAQFSSTASKSNSRPSTRDSKSSSNIMDEIAKYTPQEYSPSKQRNFNGTMVNPGLRPTLGSRPKSAFVTGTEMLSAVGRRVSGGRSSDEARRSEDGGRRSSNDNKRRFSGDRPVLARFNSHEQTRKISGSSTEAAPQEDLNVKKRGGRVMAAVAMFQGKSKDGSSKEQAALDPKAVDAAFEAVLASRNVPEPMRQKMRSLTLRVKADFVKQDQSASSNAAASSPTGTLTAQASKSSSPVEARHEQQPAEEDDSKTTKRSRPRSRTFTFSKSDKRQGETSPTKKQRPQSKSRPTSVHMPKESLSASISNAITPSTPTEHRRSVSLGRKSTAPATPADYITYLKKYQDPTKVEVGRLHKLRILLRNETVAWVDSFISLGGMSEIVALLHRTMAVEWREEHEDQLLHETLLCLKGLCTTERALAELDKVADELFPALLGMLFDDEKKGPAEYTTRNIIVSVLLNFLTAELNSTETALEERARRILAYLGEPTKPDDARPVDFVLDMRVPRPYKLWCREITHVSREVFWIFLHQLNVVPLPKPSSSGTDNGSPVDSVLDADAEERAKVLATTYTQRHFPGSRAPVPAAPYIGGVEWDATTYLSTHLDLLNGLIASLPSSSARNQLRAELQASGFEKVMGGTLRTCKEKFYSSVHDGLRAWVAAAVEDGWDTRYVREGPNMDEQAGRARSCSPKKCPQKKEAAPKLELSLGLDTKQTSNGDDGNDDGWLG